MSLRFVFAAWLAATPLAAQESFAEIQKRVSEFVLPNGMRFLVLERHNAPVASFLTWADVGAAQEVKGITGLAHIFEHMAFKGTDTIGTNNYAEERLSLERVDQAFAALQAERRKGAGADPQKLKQLEAEFQAAQERAGKFVVPNEFAEAITREGGRGLNASTSWDWTTYYYSLPSNAIELWFYLESERFLKPVLREFYKERDVVMEERRMRTESNPIGKLLEEFLAAAYKAHPYGEPVVGHMSDLENITRADAEAFFRKYYSPANLTGVIVGDVDPARVRKLAEKYFGRIPGGPKPESLRTVEPPQEAEKRVTLRLQAQRLVFVGYHKGNILHPDHAVYEALSSLLSEGRSSRLYRSLVRDKKVAVQAFGFPGLPGEKYPGLFLFAAFTAPGRTNEEVEKALDEEIEKLKTELVKPEELEGVKRRARANLLDQLRDNSTMALQLARWQVLTGDWRNLFRYLERIEAVTAADIQRVARATFTRANRTVGVIEPAEATQ
ncbi:MAG: pitrilysin family protein [Bryobacterales bacterium]|nr:insulinase family protein [Bryobacteraceae bacterium]MDW8354677.1 pitrilysin family protein [Bryobacterales bacterium]